MPIGSSEKQLKIWSKKQNAAISEGYNADAKPPTGQVSKACPKILLLKTYLNCIIYVKKQKVRML